MEAYGNFLSIFHIIVRILAILSIALFFILLLFHWIRSASFSDLKKKHDFIKDNEVRNYKLSLIFLGAGAFFVLNGFYEEQVGISIVWFFIRLFMAICLGTLIIYVSLLIIKYTWPGVVEKKLKYLRYSPRYSSSGNKMRLLTEDEEDVHLDEGMQREEDLFSVDYDVWVDEQTQEVKIEKYAGYFKVLECNNCGFHTLKLVREEIIKEPSTSADGELKKVYECQYCENKKQKIVRIAKKGIYDDDIVFKATIEQKLREQAMAKEGRLELIKIVMHTQDGGSQSYEFQKLEAARKFLENFTPGRTEIQEE
jgi:hypothetical protein